jgi:hypothetical protein
MDRAKGSLRLRRRGSARERAMDAPYPRLPPRMRARPAGYEPGMLTKALRDTGLRGWHLHACSLGAIYLCIALWIRAKTVDQEERGNAERRALFVGLWPPMFWLMGDSLQLEERAASAPRLPLRTRRRR